MCIPRKINFLQLGRYGRRGEQRYRQTFRRDFDWLCFNMNLAADRFPVWHETTGYRHRSKLCLQSWEEDSPYRSVLVRLCLGCEHGLEILGIAVIDADIKDAMMLRAVQTLNSTELEGKKITLNQWYLSVLKTYRTDFAENHFIASLPMPLSPYCRLSMD